ncbi:hypothetical protein [Zooshikella sp. RANM57]|uniref:hypothetical protein n=1 Tax=Zooshikella sp. RANM57 TaxID=3425863 RepID=UPI003D6DEDDE
MELQPTIQADPLLLQIVDNFIQKDMRLNMTVSINGLLVKGQAISFQDYLKELENNFLNHVTLDLSGKADTTEEFFKSVKASASYQRQHHIAPHYLHLNQVHYLSQVDTDAPRLLRIPLMAINTFAIG